MNHKSKSRKPWEDDSGQVLPVEVLSEISKNWSEQTWEDYLKTLEGCQRDSLVSNFKTRSRRYDADTSLREYQTREGTEQGESKRAMTDAMVRGAVDKLTYPQKRLVHLVYLEEIPLQKSAELLGITPRCAARTLQRAVSHLREILNPLLKKRGRA